MNYKYVPYKTTYMPWADHLKDFFMYAEREKDLSLAISKCIALGDYLFGARNNLIADPKYPTSMCCWCDHIKECKGAAFALLKAMKIIKCSGFRLRQKGVPHSILLNAMIQEGVIDEI